MLEEQEKGDKERKKEEEKEEEEKKVEYTYVTNATSNRCYLVTLTRIS